MKDVASSLHRPHAAQTEGVHCSSFMRRARARVLLVVASFGIN